MHRRPGRFNQKRRFAASPEDAELEQLASMLSYTGNPEHKRNPGDFGLTPPSSPRPDKALCDDAAIVHRTIALELLREGARRGLISEQRRQGRPQNIWSVAEDGTPLEAQLECAERAEYHGYPMPLSDPLRVQVLDRWRRND